MLLLAVFKVLLFRYTGLPLLAVGSPAANRDHPDFKETLGFFANHMVRSGEGGAGLPGFLS